MPSSLLTLFVLILIAASTLRLVRWAFGFWRRKRQTEPSVERCRCGYPTAKLELARCPECGRVLNFDATAEALGLTEEQLKRVAEKRRLRGD